MFPIKDNVPTRRFPIVTLGLILANVAFFFLYQVPEGIQASANELAFHPCEVDGSCPQIGEGPELTSLTSMFMHADLIHLGGNMLFLWIFGNNIEDAMGRLRFLVFYLLAGYAATALQAFITLTFGNAMDGAIPNLGASGAVSGVLGAYLLLLPRARVVILIFLFILLIREIPAYLFLGFWFLFQLWSGGVSLLYPQGGGGVAFFAHVGGFVFGMLTVKLLAKHRPVQPAY